ncbi:MAG: PH domain-containing protein [Chloroflexi bacterium]|nr:PH domain-containing protein [Chloroflexota bacterium]
MSTQREEVVAEFRRSTRTFGFWWRTILTLTLYYWLLWRRNVITVTNRRVVQRTGNIIGGEETSIQISRITDVTVSTGVIEAIFGYGLIEIQSAGSGGAEIRFDGIARPHKLKEIIFDLQDGMVDGGPVGQDRNEDYK